MKRRYEVAYYECGLTKRISRRFCCELIAYLFKGYIEYKTKDFGTIEFRELELDE